MCDIAAQNVFGLTISADCHDGFDFTLISEENFFLPPSLHYSGAAMIHRETGIPASTPWLALASIHRNLLEPLVEVADYPIY
ncbi:hypothetical protein N7517_005918 [Penicillium concentricum]|uniref:Uncharacterized protein n=1 Tax=Penicillium concentricum TaxID=293559 RepID=A0A9W9S899_9EURO|nr:uncharacterized protein N7517_005918 [Penicillium concentricum]KAJ5373912.1 hypothetical protein N7517_005918 [Penicillium concentricum]